MRTAHPHVIKGHDSAGDAERDRLPAFDKVGPSNRFLGRGIDPAGPFLDG
ncbi:MAG: hypothetical protein WBX22_06845 [Silvibacterium sp.]